MRSNRKDFAIFISVPLWLISLFFKSEVNVKRLEDKVAIITGSTGIGGATAKLFTSAPRNDE